MPDNDPGHAARVDAWLHTAHGVELEQMLALFERAMAALVARARPTLGDVTLAAILDRVLYSAAVDHPFLAQLTIDDGNLRFDALRARAGTVQRTEAAAATRSVVLGFISLLGTLTADILSPALHLVLASVTLADDGKKS